MQFSNIPARQTVRMLNPNILFIKISKNRNIHPSIREKDLIGGKISNFIYVICLTFNLPINKIATSPIKRNTNKNCQLIY